jgi:hypothetical protein
MTEALKKLIAEARKVVASKEEREQQRRSFAFGNTNIENSRITRETIDREADNLRRQNGK